MNEMVCNLKMPPPSPQDGYSQAKDQTVSGDKNGFKEMLETKKDAGEQLSEKKADRDSAEETGEKDKKPEKQAVLPNGFPISLLGFNLHQADDGDGKAANLAELLDAVGAENGQTADALLAQTAGKAGDLLSTAQNAAENGKDLRDADFAKLTSSGELKTAMGEIKPAVEVLSGAKEESAGDETPQNDAQARHSLQTAGLQDSGGDEKYASQADSMEKAAARTRELAGNAENAAENLQDLKLAVEEGAGNARKAETPGEKAEPEHLLQESGKPESGDASSVMTPGASADENGVWQTAGAKQETYVNQNDEVMNQVRDYLDKNLVKGARELELQLNPKDLGKLSLKIAVENGRTEVTILCSNSSTMKLLSEKAGEIGRIMENTLGSPTTIVTDFKDEAYKGYSEDDQGREGGQGQKDGGGRESGKNGQSDEQKHSSSAFIQQLRLGLI